ncbi:MAG TPA: hypothetical protein VIM55_01095, partial [Mucilaginibacter sp.]
MSESTAQEPAAAPLAQNFRPQDNIFRSFNALTPNIFENLISNLRTVRQGDMSEYITITNDARKFDGVYRRQSSSFESMEEFSTSV